MTDNPSDAAPIDVSAEVSTTSPTEVTSSGPWPNQSPVVEGIDEVSQDPDFVINDEEKS